MKGLTKTSATQGIPVFQQVHETASGGFKLDTSTLTADAEVVAGTPVSIDEAARTAKVVKTATLHADAADTDTDYQVEKGAHLKVGDYLAAAAGGAAYAITAIDTSNAAYDVATVGTTLGVALTAGDVLFQSSATGANAAAGYTPNGLVYQGVKVETGADVAVVTRGTVYARRVPGVTAAIKAALPTIIFSNSK